MNLSFAVWRDAFVVAIAISIMLVMYVVAGTPTRETSRLGMRGLKRERALSRGGLFAHVEPLIRWFGVRVSGLVSDPTRAPTLDRQLRVAGDYLGLTAEEYLGAIVLGAAVADALRCRRRALDRQHRPDARLLHAVRRRAAVHPHQR